MAGPSQIQEEEESEDWMTTYADAITLLMAFFVMLLTFSKYDVPAFEEAVAAIKNKVGGWEGLTPTEKLKESVEEMVYDMQADQAVGVEVDDEGIVITLASGAFYKPGSAEIREAAIPVLKTMAQTILAPAYQTYLIEIEGHTDDDPIRTRLYPSNWELSAGRATRVARFLIDEGADGRRLKAAGFAETRPVAENRDAEGNAIKENQAENRRVVIRVYPMPYEDREKFLDQMVDEELEEEERIKAEAEDGDNQQQAPPAEGGAAPQAGNQQEGGGGTGAADQRTQ